MSKIIVEFNEQILLIDFEKGGSYVEVEEVRHPIIEVIQNEEASMKQRT